MPANSTPAPMNTSQEGIDTNKNEDGTGSINTTFGDLDTTTKLGADGEAINTRWKHSEFELNSNRSRTDIEHAGGIISSTTDTGGDTGMASLNKNPWYTGGGYSTISQTKGSKDIWYSPGPNQISKIISGPNDNSNTDMGALASSSFKVGEDRSSSANSSTGFKEAFLATKNDARKTTPVSNPPTTLHKNSFLTRK